MTGTSNIRDHRGGDNGDAYVTFNRLHTGLYDESGNVVNPANPLPAKDIDGANRVSSNTVFGEKNVGVRKVDIAAQFQYGFPLGSADPDVSNGGTITTVDSMLTVSTGTNAAGAASIANRKALRYIPGHEAYTFFTAVFTEGVADSYQRAGLFDDQNGFFIGYEGADFKVTRRRKGVDTSVTITLADIFEDGSYDPTKGNVYKISFGYLGFATIVFEVLQPNGQWVILHKIEYPNSSTETHITNTNLPPRTQVANTGNTSNIVFKTGSFTAGIVDGGGGDPAARRFTYTDTAKAIVAVSQMVVTFRSKSTFSSLTNYIETLFTLLSLATDLSKNSTWEFRRNMTITNSPTWADINTLDSTIEYSTDAAVTSGTGESLLAFSMGKTDRIYEQIEDEDVSLLPSDTLTLVNTTPTGTTGTFDLSLREKELF